MVGIIHGGGVSSDDVTATSNLVLKGYTAITKDSNDEPIEGTLDVQSIQSFSAESDGVKRVILSWKNPLKGAFSGAIVVYRTDRYPTSIADGTRIYTGYGNNQNPDQTSSVVVDMPSENTNYYFLAVGYAIKNGEEWLDSQYKQGYVKTSVSRYAFTSSTTFTVPAGVKKINVFCVGGGGGGGTGVCMGVNNRTGWYGAGGGGGGYTKTVSNYSVTPGQKIAVTIGAGGSAPGNPAIGNTGSSGGTGGTSSLGNICSANGGNGGKPASYGQYYGGNGGAGGSGGGGGCLLSSGTGSPWARVGGTGGSNGGNGGNGQYHIADYGQGTASNSGAGQRTTTKEFGSSNGTLYSGGGGGGQYEISGSNAGSGGGGRGATGSGTAMYIYSSAGSNGYGGGGGGGVFSSNFSLNPSRGGSGIVVITCL